MRDYSDDLRWVDGLITTRTWVLRALVLVVMCAVAVSVFAQGSGLRQHGVIFDCIQLAAAVGKAATLRDVGADVGLVIAMVREKNVHLGGPRLEVLGRELHRLWAEGRPAADAEYQLYLRCNQQLGDMGREG